MSLKQNKTKTRQIKVRYFKTRRNRIEADKQEMQQLGWKKNIEEVQCLTLGVRTALYYRVG